jgi:hypothetical protein
MPKSDKTTEAIMEHTATFDSASHACATRLGLFALLKQIRNLPVAVPGTYPLPEAQ